MSEKTQELHQLESISTRTERTNALLSSLIKSNKELNSNIHSRLGWVAVWLFLIWANMIFFGI